MSGNPDSILRRPDVRGLLSWAVQGNEKIMPLPRREGKRFPELSRLFGDTAKIVALLEELVSCDIFRKVKAYSQPACPSCGFIDIFDNHACPYCEGQDLEKGDQVQHHSCGYVDREVRFQKDGQLICPRCLEELKLIGTDYQRIENIFHCNHCERDFSVARLVHTCVSCGISFPYEKADLKPAFGYILNEEKRDEIIANSLIGLPIIRLLETRGYDVTAPGILKGRSGTEHLFDIVATQDGKSTVFTLTTGPHERDQESVLSLFAKFYDVHAERAVLIAVPGLSPNGKRLAETYGIEYVEGTATEEILRDMPMLTSGNRVSILTLDRILQRENLANAASP